MANPTFWYYPDPTGDPVSIDLADTLSDLVETPITEATDARGLDWVTARSVKGAGLRIRVVLERFGGPSTSSLERSLRTLENHLHRGGLCAFAADSAKAWAGVSSSALVPGATSWTGSGRLFNALAPSATLASGDELVIETASPENMRQYLTAGATMGAGNTHTLGSAVQFPFAENSVLRWRDFFPILSLPEDQTGKTLVTNDHRRNFTLDVDLEYTPARVIAWWGGPIAQAAQAGAFEGVLVGGQKAGGAN